MKGGDTKYSKRFMDLNKHLRKEDASGSQFAIKLFTHSRF